MYCHRIKGGKTRLMFFFAPAHISDRIQPGKDPQTRCHQAKNSPKRRDRKINRQTISNLRNKKPRCVACLHRQRDMQRRNESDNTADGSSRITPDWPRRHKRCQAGHHQWCQNTNKQCSLRCHHRPPPRSAAAAARDAATNQLASTPNQIFVSATIHNGK